MNDLQFRSFSVFIVLFVFLFILLLVMSYLLLSYKSSGSCQPSCLLQKRNATKNTNSRKILNCLRLAFYFFKKFLKKYNLLFCLFVFLFILFLDCFLFFCFILNSQEVISCPCYWKSAISWRISVGDSCWIVYIRFFIFSGRFQINFGVSIILSIGVFVPFWLFCCVSLVSL